MRVCNEGDCMKKLFVRKVDFFGRIVSYAIESLFPELVEPTRKIHRARHG